MPLTILGQSSILGKIGKKWKRGDYTCFASDFLLFYFLLLYSENLMCYNEKCIV